jgi:hypothetical protein
MTLFDIILALWPLKLSIDCLQLLDTPNNDWRQMVTSMNKLRHCVIFWILWFSLSFCSSIIGTFFWWIPFTTFLDTIKTLLLILAYRPSIAGLIQSTIIQPSWTRFHLYFPPIFKNFIEFLCKRFPIINSYRLKLNNFITDFIGTATQSTATALLKNHLYIHDDEIISSSSHSTNLNPPPSVHPTNLTPSVHPTNLTPPPSIQPTNLTPPPSIQPTNLTPSIQSTNLTPSVQPPNLTPSVQPPNLTPSVQPPNLTPSIQSTNLTPSIQSTNLAPSVQPPNLNLSVQSTNLAPSVQPPNLNLSVQSTNLNPMIQLNNTNPSPTIYPSSQIFKTGSSVMPSIPHKNPGTL